MSMEKSMEMAQLLARFKLQVKRSLAESVDLEALTRDPIYARRRLSEIEEAAGDEDLLIMVLRLRDHLLPPADLPSPVIAQPPEIAPEPSSQRETRSYLMGARAW
ncbi:hypothetical protein LZ012_08420 [Dechloromonas sp. XY25]|uniref:Uncharacterized protein n=1 Tax=Dechloromonas hankyongensis TaxID=2908002 RepID=A0ABS9K1H4_9RHOO|nr:hypothetical protein [Dechloromonas hankyongensis]MCG2577019.1 hypothetical protein [Dechloromonas hankyongensis]